MRALILEDEKAAARHLERLLERLAPGMRVVATLGSVRGAVAWLRENPSPDLILMDVELGDGAGFDVALEVPLGAPVIVTTAYDHYALRAFDVDSVDYLLKPIREAELARALTRLEERRPLSRQAEELERLRSHLSASAAGYRSRLLSRLGDRLVSVAVEEVAYFHRAGLVLAHTHDGRRLPLDRSLEELVGLVDPGRFFRVNRQCLAAVDAFQEIRSVGRGRLRLRLRPDLGEPLFVSEERGAVFRQWLERGAR